MGPKKLAPHPSYIMGSVAARTACGPGGSGGERMADRIASGNDPGRAHAGSPDAAPGNGRHQDVDKAPTHGEWVHQAVARYEKPLTQYAAHVLGEKDADRASDLAQEAFLR